MSESEVEKAPTTADQLDHSSSEKLTDQQISQPTTSDTTNDPMATVRQERDEKCEKAWEEWLARGSCSMYHMPEKDKGLLVIFSIENFLDGMNLEKRDGTKKDVQILTETFENMEFKVISYEDCTSYDFRTIPEKIAKREDLQDMGCLAVSILTHWKDADYLYAIDGEIEITAIATPFEKCAALAGKPKLFFIQTCRGRKIDYGHNFKDTDAEPPPKFSTAPPIKIPMQSDFFYAYSTPPGYLSRRHRDKGSWFIRALCECIKRYAEEKDLLSIMTLVSSAVGHLPLYAEKDDGFVDSKQIPSFVSQLSKDLYFYPKAVQEDAVGSSTDSPGIPSSNMTDVMTEE